MSGSWEADAHFYAVLRDSPYVRFRLEADDTRFGWVRREPPRAAPGASQGRAPEAPEPAVGVEVRSPTPGVVTSCIGQGDTVVAGDEIASIQVHRRRVAVHAEATGTLAGVTANPGEFVEYGQALARIEYHGA